MSLSNILKVFAILTENCTSVKFFNNQDEAGKLLRGWNGTQRILELEDEVQDVLLGI